jgi:hemerythrin-like domain-containing protein
MAGLAAMQGLEQDHATGLVLADRLDALLQQGDAAALQQAVLLIQAYAPELEAHLQQEEQSVLRPLVQNHREHLALCVRLGREHGLLRTLTETIAQVDPALMQLANIALEYAAVRSLAADMRQTNAALAIADFAQLLRVHTLVEDAELFPLVAELFNAEQLQTIADFAPLAIIPPVTHAETAQVTNPAQLRVWLNVLRAHLHRQPENGVHFVLLPRYAPEFVQFAAQELGLSLFDYQQAVMADYREQAEFIPLDAMLQSLQNQAQQQAYIFHNAEALLCVKSEAERRAWLTECLALELPHRVLMPLTLYQAEVPETARAITIHG